MRIKKPGGAAKMQPPMTPMIDCIFNLLIFFMLTPSSMSEGYLTTNLPTTSGPGSAKTVEQVRIKIELFDEGPKGEDVSIRFNETQEMGSNFNLLRAALEEKRAQGLAADTPVLISPTMSTRHKWVVQAFDKAVQSRFTNIQFAVPYE
jgi:biopolymer transport protein ExbD